MATSFFLYRFFGVLLSYLLIGLANLTLLKAQHLQIDSLFSLLKTQKNDSLTVDLLNKLAYAYYRVDADSTLYFAQRSKSLAAKTHYFKGEAEAIRLLAVGSWVKGEYVRTIQYAQEAIQIFEKINDKDGISRSYNTIGLVYYRKKEYDKALLYYEKGLKIDEELHLDKNISIKFTNIGIIHESRKDYNKALLFLFKSLQIGEKIGFIEFTLVTMRHIGEVYLKQQEYSKAILFANKTLLLAKQLGSERELTLAFILLGKIAIQEQRLNVAEQQLLQALFWANKTKEKEHSKEAAENLYILFKKKRQDTKALFYHELVQKYQDSLYSEKKETEIKNLEFSYQLQLKEKEIDLLKKDSLLKEQAQKRNIIMIVSLLTIIVLMTLLAVIFFKGRQKQQKANHLLQVKHKEIVRQQNELLEKTRALEASNHLKNKLFSIIGHDVRSPLNSLRGLLSLVVLEGLSAEEVNDLYKNINKQLTGLEAMLSNLLQWSKSQMEGERSYLVRVNLQETMTEVVNLLQPTADFKAIQITLEAIEESTVQVDVNQVRAIFRNLLTNAIKFTAQQGLITVKIYREGGNCVVVSIADTGVGMSKKVLERLFQPKTHFSTYGTDNEKGTGLGLLLVKEFADKNMIELSIKSEEGVGTVFILRFMA